MRRLVGLVSSGVLIINVNPPRTGSVSASPFWQEKDGEAPLPAGGRHEMSAKLGELRDVSNSDR